MPDEHSPGEKYWQVKYSWLESCGYQLRPRYRPGWTPSWITDPPKDSYGRKKREDYTYFLTPQIMDAIRVKDGRYVMLKRIHKLQSGYNQEVEISLYLSSPELSKDPCNHCVPIYELLEPSDDDTYSILVMPLLREFDADRFDTVGECVDFFQEIFKGLQFIHQQHIVHRDCTGPNVMMDGSVMYPYGFHPVKPHRNREFTGSAKQAYTRTQRPPKYYWIDFGNSARFDPWDKSPRIYPVHGTDHSAPEFQDPKSEDQLLDPFPTDIYYLGNLIRLYFTEGWPDLGFPKVYGLDFLKPLVNDMVNEDPMKRPTIDQCVIRLNDIIRQQSSWTLRAQVWHSDDNIFGFVYRFFPHWARRLYYIVTQTRPIPCRPE
ncbi:hypothetical protein BDN70DRAFT_992808 [Pholiota conissans]|uniref:Protein kinase domain-containing protein n=1 Tax=Pholiota conissans TaxID=109636 RepID=A0A9P5Z3R6_9AGAR|nr:hypothetical protein BDN70DRAFT_992808 [Pholiota conissans]